ALRDRLGVPSWLQRALVPWAGNPRGYVFCLRLSRRRPLLFQALDHQRGQTRADRGRELEAVTAARRADDDAAVTLEDEAFVVRGRVETGLERGRALGGSRKALVHPRSRLLDERCVGLAGLV